ncbi:MAG TPA: hypothetical protein VE983_04125, partial [Solirubrobacteraceae bacterium]|nr:hypothetical protein [Solirubrobacteraceae bacterium]
MRGVALAAGLLAILAPLAGARQRSSAGAAPTAVALSTAPSNPALHVIPFPNTPDASAESEIIFSALRPSDLAGDPVVTGSSSGVHPGKLARLPDHAGTVFSPAQPFTPGERVTVRAPLTSPRAGTASGDPGSMSLSFSFTVASPPPTTGATARAASVRAHASSRDYLDFRSQPQLHPTLVHVSSARAPGTRDIFVSPRSLVLFAPTPKHSNAQSGPMILNPSGQLVWFYPLPGKMVAFNLEEQTYRGQPVLTWWQGGAGYGSQDMIFNASYQPVAVVKGGWGYGP